MTRRTNRCGQVEARARLRKARQYLLVAQTSLGDEDLRDAATGNAVLAAIAAVDALCCAKLGEMSRSRDHRDAVDLVRQIDPEGKNAARRFGRVLSLKDKAQYDHRPVTRTEATTAVRHAAALVDVAANAIS